MIEKIKIFYAYNGFLYSPLFIADKIGLLPKNIELINTKSDFIAIESLYNQDSVQNEIFFSICDPFAGVFDEHTSEQYDDQIYIIGSLINRLPFWLYNTNPEIRDIKQESDLIKFDKDIKNIISYKEGTTGFVIAKRLQKIIKKPIEVVEFGNEFNFDTNENLILTADALSMVDNGLNHKNIVFNYPMKSVPELNPFLFTGIHTLKTNIDRYLWVVLNTLGALQVAIKHLSESNLESTIISNLVDAYSNHDSIKSKIQNNEIEKCNKLLKDTCLFLFRGQKIYDSFPYPTEKNDWVRSWNNAKAQWKDVFDHEFPEAESVEEPIPALLIKQNWQKKLYETYKRFIEKEPSTESELSHYKINRVPKHKFYLTMGAILFTLLSIGYGFIHGFNIYSANPIITSQLSKFWLHVISTVFLIVVNIWVYNEAFNKPDISGKNRFEFSIGVYGMIVALAMILCFAL